MSGTPKKRDRVRFRTPLLWVTQGIVLAVFAGFILFNWDYYGLPRAQRPLHEGHHLLRSSGRAGLWMGIGAATLFVLNLGYLVRKRLIRISWLGPLRGWMNLHVVTGIIGAGGVAVHMAMAPSSAMGMLALGALCITVVTGIIGRTIYIRVPRSAEGRELEFQQVQEGLARYRQELEAHGVDIGWLQHGSLEQAVKQRRSSLLENFIALVAGDRQRQQDYRRLKQAILNVPRLKESARRILPMASAYCFHLQWFTQYYQLRSLIASWRFFHRWLAILMLFVVLAHVLVAIRFGGLHVTGGGRV